MDNKPVFFENQNDFRRWLDENHQAETELLVGFYKTGSGKPSMTWPQSVDQALCYGWIDGVRKSMGPEAYSIRFTPRKPGSIWSAINIDKMEKLVKENLVKPAGLAAFAKRTEAKSRIYSHERTQDAVLPPDMEKAFKSHKKAWAFFTAQAPSYQRVMLHWVTTAKQEKTRQGRFEKLLEASRQGTRVS
jgi:uncharacterized protein YdeI (YjbR/CyaY-like superfamily)